MVRLEDTVLMRSELLELSFEELRLLVRNRLLVENENVGDVVRVNLRRSVTEGESLVSMNIPCPSGRARSALAPS